MTTVEILKELETMGSENIKRIFMRQGAREPIFGVKVGDMKKIVKRVKKNHELSIDLYATGISDAMYLAGLIADEKKIGKEELRRWAEQAPWLMISEYTVAWVAAESPYGWELGLEWIESDQESIATAGWNTLSGWLMLRPDAELDLPALEQMLDRVAATIHSAKNRVRYTMNGFVMTCGIAVAPLHEKALAVAGKIGEVKVNMGDTACQVPIATEYITHAVEKGRLGQKKKMVRC